MFIFLEIPKEFVVHFNSDRFYDSLNRIRFDVVDSIRCGDVTLSGNYEIELLDMLIRVFIEALVC